jgi:hypothetical protein
MLSKWHVGVVIVIACISFIVIDTHATVMAWQRTIVGRGRAAADASQGDP